MLGTTNYQARTELTLPFTQNLEHVIKDVLSFPLYLLGANCERISSTTYNQDHQEETLRRVFDEIGSANAISSSESIGIRTSRTDGSL